MSYLPNEMGWAIQDRWGEYLEIEALRRDAIRAAVRTWFCNSQQNTLKERSLLWAKMRRRGFRVVKVWIVEVE